MLNGNPSVWDGRGYYYLSACGTTYYLHWDIANNQWDLMGGGGGTFDTAGSGMEPQSNPDTGLTITRYSVEAVAKGRPAGTIGATREPIDTVNGAMFMDETDLVLPAAGFNLEWCRTYNSTNSAVNGPLGPGWSHNYAWQVAETTLVVAVMGVTNSHPGMVLKVGADDAMSLVQNGTNRTWSSTRGVIRTVVATSDGYQLNLPGGVGCHFGTNGLATSITNGWGNLLSFAYTNVPGGPQLAEVDHSDGRALRFTYASNRLMRVDSPSANLYVLYSYNAAGELTNAVSQTSAGAIATAYAYDTVGTNRHHSLMTRVNAKGETTTYLYRTNAAGESSSTCVGMSMTSNYYAHAVAFDVTNNSTTVTYQRNATNTVYTYGYNAAADSRCVTRIVGAVDTSVTHRIDYDPSTLLATNEQWEARQQYAATIVAGFGLSTGQVYAPSSLALDSLHRLYVTEPQEHRVQMYDPMSKGWTAWSQVGTNAGQFEAPCSVAVDSKLNVYVGDLGNFLQMRSASNGQWTIVASAGTNAWQVMRPASLACDAQDNLYIVDEYLNRVQRRKASDGTWTILVRAGDSNGAVSSPEGVALTGTNVMYVTDAGNQTSTNGHRLQKFDGNGAWLDTLASAAATNGGFKYPRGIAPVGDSLYVADGGNSRVVCGNKGRWQTLVSSNILHQPQAVVYDSNGILYIADTGNDRILGLPLVPGATIGTNGQSIVSWSSGDVQQSKIRRQFDSGLHLTNAAMGYLSDPTNAWQLSWNTNWDMPASVTDPEGHRAELDYANGAVSKERVFPATNQPAETTYAYTSSGLLAAVTNANGHCVQYQYNSYGYLTNASPQAGPTNSMVWDNLGHLKEIDLPGTEATTNDPPQPIPRAITFDPDELGRVRQITWPDNSFETFGFDAMGNVTNHVDTAGRTTLYTWLPTRKLASVTRGSGAEQGTVGFTYDQQFNTLKISDERGRPVESYQLDLQDRPVQITNIESQQMSIAWGLVDVVQSLRRFDGTPITFAYDEGARVSKVTYPDQTMAFRYFKNGLPMTASNQWGVISNAFDGANRLTSQSSPAPNGTVSYARYPAGQVSNVVNVAGTNTFTLDAAERLDTLTTFRKGLASASFQYSYNGLNGAVSNVVYPNGAVTCSPTYDKMDRLSTLSWENASNQVLQCRSYTYNSAGMISQISYETGEQVVYTYDSLDRLTGEQHLNAAGQTTSQETYGFDLAGNRTNKTVWSGTTPLMTVNYSLGVGNRLASWSVAQTDLVGQVDVVGTSSETIGTNDRFGWLYVSNLNGRASTKPYVSGTNFWAYELMVGLGTQKVVAAIRDVAGNTTRVTNQVFLTVVTNGTYQYSAAGCVTNIAYAGKNYSSTLGLTWDGRYQLTAAATNGTVVEQHGYDALGRRLWTWDTVNGTNWLVYDGAQVVADLNATGSLVRAYTYGPGIDNILSMTVYGTATNTYYYLKDHLGSVLALTSTNGVIVESYRYDAWGRTTVYDAAGNTLVQSSYGNRYCWQGREYSYKTGLYYFRARWYDPVGGRFLSNDPIGISGGLNQFVFCGNNPVNFRDPSGLLYDALESAATSGYQRGGISGTGQAWGACAASAVLDAIGGRGVEKTAGLAGSASGNGNYGQEALWLTATASLILFDAASFGAPKGAFVNAGKWAKNIGAYETGAGVLPGELYGALSGMDVVGRGELLLRSTSAFDRLMLALEASPKDWLLAYIEGPTTGGLLANEALNLLLHYPNWEQFYKTGDCP